MDLPVINPVSVSTIVEICNMMGSLVEPSFQPVRTTALVVRSTGEVIVTSSGMKVLLESCCNHPLSQLIVNAVSSHHQQTGDGSKWFLLMLKEVMTAIGKKKNGRASNFRMELINEILSLIQIFPCIFRYLRGTSPSVILELCIHTKEITVSSVEAISWSFFRTKFSLPEAGQLSALMRSLIFESAADLTKLDVLINHMKSNFSILCTKVQSSFKESRTREGIIFGNNIPLSVSFNFESTVNFVVLSNVSDEEGFKETILKVERKSVLKQLIELNHTFYSRFLNLLKIKEISLILTSDAATKELLSMCTDHKIHLIDRISNEEIEFLISITGVQPLHCFVGNIEPKNISKVKFAKIITIGRSRYLHIAVNSSIHWLYPQHLVICAPIENVCKEYYFECWNCLKAISQWLSKDIPCCDGDRQCLCKSSVMQSYNKYFREENNCFQCDIKNNANESNHFPSMQEIQIYDKIAGFAYPSATWELSFSNILTSSCLKSNSSIESVRYIVASALLKVIKRKHSIPLLLETCHFQENCLELQNKLKTSIAFETKKSSLEPVASKELLMCNVLNLVVQLLKINGIVKANNFKSKCMKK